MYDLQTVLDHYFAAWNATEPSERREHIRAALAEDATYADPLADVRGHDGVDSMLAALQAQYPQHTVRRASAVDVHHDKARFEWEILTPAGDVYVAGIDYATVAADGRLQSVAGFFGPVPADTAA